MDQARAHEVRPADVTLFQAAILEMVKRIKRPVTPSLISRWLFRESHTVSAALDRMEKQGLIKKVKDLPRKNVVRVELTEKGEEAYQRTSSASSIRDIVSCLSPEERDTFRALAERLRDKAIEERRTKMRWLFP
jgi:DNA-binding MarR family transcriptional regulator